VSFAGDVTVKNATVIDNILAGIEYEKVVETSILGQAKVEGGRVVRHSTLLDSSIDDAENVDGAHGTHGIIGPRTDWFTIKNTKFY